MRQLFLVLAALYTVAGQAQTDDLRVYASASDPFTIELPRSFVYGTEAEVAPGKRVHLFQELREGGRTVTLDTDVGLSDSERAAFVDGSALRRSLPQFTFSAVPLSDLPLSEFLAGSAESAFAFVNGASPSREVGYIVRGCDERRCFSLGVGGPDESDGASEDHERRRYADLLSGFQFVD